MTARGTWKAYERRVAADLGGKRIPVTGLDRHGADVKTDMFHIQTKLRKTIPNWLFDWLGGICGTAEDAGKTGILILKTPHMRDSESLVVMRFGDFVALHGKPESPLDKY